jgi:hypothetical protein
LTKLAGDFVASLLEQAVEAAIRRKRGRFFPLATYILTMDHTNA